jgi:MipA family protein
LVLRGDRIGLKFAPAADQRIDVFFKRRLDGYPLHELPAALEGMEFRNYSVDLGVTWRTTLPFGTLSATLTQDVGSVSKGRELSVALLSGWSSGRWALRPGVGLAWRDARLNDTYYGVTAAEATPTRPAYAPGAGIDTWLGLYGSYQVSSNWRLLGGVSLNLLSSGVRASPIVESGTQPALTLGAVYDFGSHRVTWAGAESPTLLRVIHGRASDDGCHMIKIITLRCTDVNRTTPTTLTGIFVGKPFVEGFNGWPVDFVGYAGLVHHDDRPYQPNGWQADLFMKAYFHGFPWSHRVKTRVGFGLGVSIAGRVPYEEANSQAIRGRPNSRVLNYLDPSIEISIGDMFGKASMEET